MAAPRHGSVCWHEIHSPNSTATARFYKGLFGWGAKKATGLGMPYSFLSHAKTDFGGIAPLDKKSRAKPHWLVYFTVDDIEAATKKARKLGGKAATPIIDLPMGRIAVFSDPTGAAFGLYQGNGQA